MPSSHLILCHPLLLLPPIPPSIRIFSSESTLRMRWPKYWSFSLSISPSNEYSRLISFRIEWFDFLSVQGSLKSLLKRHSGVAKSWTWLSDWKTITLHYDRKKGRKEGRNVLVIVNNSAMNIGVHISFCFLWEMQVELLDDITALFLVFWDTSIMYFIVAVSI